MESAFAWISSIIEWFGRLIPQIILVRATHGGVKFVRGYKVKRLSSGLHVYWPITTEVEIIPIARQTHLLKPQALMTKDGKSIAAGCTVIFRITDIEKALVESWDVNDSIVDVAQAAIVKVVSSLTLQDLTSQISGRVENELTQGVRAKLESFGVEVERCALTDLSSCRVLKLLGSMTS